MPKQTTTDAPDAEVTEPADVTAAEPAIKFPIDAKTAARLVRADERFAGGKVTDKAIRRLVREHDIAGMDDDRYTRHLYDEATFALIVETYFAPSERRAASVAADAPAEAE